MAEKADKPAALQIEQDLRLQRVTWVLQRIGWLFLVAIMVAGLLGILGDGPLSETRKATADGALAVRYDRFTHRLTPTRLEIDIRPPNSQLRVTLDANYLKRMKVEKVHPEPESVKLQGDQVVYEFEADLQPAEITFDLEAQHSGKAEGAVALEGAGGLAISQLVYP